MSILKCGKKLLSNCPTRWSSTFLLLEQLLVVKEPLTAVLNELEWDNLAKSEWKAIDSICRLLRPFAQYTTLVSGKNILLCLAYFNYNGAESSP